MPVRAESREYAEERLERILRRHSYRYAGNYYVNRSCNSASNRMTNIRKLTVWAEVLRVAGYETAAIHAEDRIRGLDNGMITLRPRRPRLARTQVPVYVPVEPVQIGSDVHLVTYNFVGEA